MSTLIIYLTKKELTETDEFFDNLVEYYGLAKEQKYVIIDIKSSSTVRTMASRIFSKGNSYYYLTSLKYLYRKDEVTDAFIITDKDEPLKGVYYDLITLGLYSDKIRIHYVDDIKETESEEIPAAEQK